MATAATAATAAEEKTAPTSKPGGRGPSYPSLTIEAAIAKAQQFWAAEKRNAAPLAAAVKHWGYSATSSSGKVAAAALLQYGLLEDQGANDSRTVKLTARGLDILLDAPDSPKRLQAIRDAVSAPKLHGDVLTKWPAHELPSDSTLRFYLLREKSFNESSVDGFIKDFRASIAYANLDKPSTITMVNGKVAPEKPVVANDIKKDAPEVGDLIQWEASGVLRLEAPRRVRAKQEHEGEWWVFVDGSETGIPMSEAVTLEKKVADAAPKAPPTLAIVAEPASAQMQPAKGEREWLRGPLSREVGYRLLVSGDVGPKEIGKLIKLLEAQKEVLDEENA